jgi:cobalt-zinc-cadmium efflux system outer membrane protein
VWLDARRQPCNARSPTSRAVGGQAGRAEARGDGRPIIEFSMSRPATVLGLTALALTLAPGCAMRAQVTPQDAADRLQVRTGAAPRVAGATPAEIPAGIHLEDGLTADEAVAVALWNNAAFQVSVSELGFARADLLDAGLLTNPVLSLLFPIGPKQLEATLRWPVEVLWERPRRIAVARLAADAAGHRLVQAGLDLVLAVRSAHADLNLAIDRQRLATETAALLVRIDALTQSRLAAGDIGELDARAARVDAARGQQDAERAVHDVAIAVARLRLLLGLSGDAPAFDVRPSPITAACGPSADLLREALVARPDVRAAELGVETAAARLGWERSRILALAAVLDANGEGIEGFEAGPGVDASLPLFNRNQGGRARAGAELQRASAAYAAIQQQVALELREATALFDQARESLATWQDRIVLPLETNVTDANRSYTEGDTSYLFVLEHTRRLTDARVRERELAADEQRARARIERAVGRSCSAPPQEASRVR